MIEKHRKTVGCVAYRYRVPLADRTLSIPFYREEVEWVVEYLAPKASAVVRVQWVGKNGSPAHEVYIFYRYFRYINDAMAYQLRFG